MEALLPYKSARGQAGQRKEKTSTQTVSLGSEWKERKPFWHAGWTDKRGQSFYKMSKMDPLAQGVEVSGNESLVGPWTQTVAC